MGKKPNSKSAPGAKAASRKINIALLVGVVLLLAGIGWYSMQPPAAVPEDIANLAKPDLTTLDPANFSGTARLAYQAAKEIPEVLAQLPCYCGCMQNFGHKNNLYCFHDEHGLECTMCQDIALDAHQMYKNGLTMQNIRENIQRKFSQSAGVIH